MHRPNTRLNAADTAVGDARCPVTFWRFAVPLVVGNLAGIGTGYVARRLATKEHPSTAKTIGIISGTIAFWTVAGTMWVALNRNGHTPT